MLGMLNKTNALKIIFLHENNKIKKLFKPIFLHILSIAIKC